jgi:hypothetical protein
VEYFVAWLADRNPMQCSRHLVRYISIDNGPMPPVRAHTTPQAILGERERKREREKIEYRIYQDTIHRETCRPASTVAASAARCLK